MSSEQAKAEMPNAILTHIGEITREVVNSDVFIHRLASAIQQKAGNVSLLNAIPRDQIGPGNLAAEPRPTASGMLVLLTRFPVIGGHNLRLTALSNSNVALDGPTPEGETRLKRYRYVLTQEDTPNDMAAVKVINLSEELTRELERQLEPLLTAPAVFFYVQVLQEPKANADAEHPHDH